MHATKVQPDRSAKSSAGDSRDRLPWLVCLLLLVAIALTYLPIDVLTGQKVLYGSDHVTLHEYRLDYVKRAFAAGEGLPGWYTAELLGQPFWANIQNFPWNPAHLVLLLVHPAAAFSLGVVISGWLLGGLTWAYARKMGFSLAGSFAAGYSIACCGFFMVRIIAGHLHLLESLFCLPLLLLLQEWYFSRQRAGGGLRLPLALVAGAALVTVLNGHPQMPFYFLVTAAVYPLFRTGWRHWIKLWAAMSFGGGLGFFVWWPMLLLVRRSFRMLPLAPARNDVVFPVDGILNIFRIPPDHLITEDRLYIFMETTNFIGQLPLLAVIGLGVLWVRGKLPVRPVGWFFLVAGLFSVITALPWVRELPLPFDATVFRSPSRQVFIALFGLALGLGLGVTLLEKALANQRGWIRHGVIWVLVAVQVFQLASFGSHFVQSREPQRAAVAGITRLVAELPPGARIAMNLYFQLQANRRIDDIGFFDSLMLADSYTTMARAGGASEQVHGQSLDSGLNLPAAALRDFSVHYVIDSERHPELPTVFARSNFVVSKVLDPQPRVTFLARGDEPLKQSGAPVIYKRPAADRMVLQIDAPAEGVLFIRESFDPGWRATRDGEPTEITQYKPRNFMLISVPAGASTVELTYHTPGAAVGLMLSGVSGVCLVGLLVLFGGNRRVNGGARRDTG